MCSSAQNGQFGQSSEPIAVYLVGVCRFEVQLRCATCINKIVLTVRPPAAAVCDSWLWQGHTGIEQFPDPVGAEDSQRYRKFFCVVNHPTPSTWIATVTAQRVGTQQACFRPQEPHWHWSVAIVVPKMGPQLHALCTFTLLVIPLLPRPTGWLPALQQSMQSSLLEIRHAPEWAIEKGLWRCNLGHAAWDVARFYFLTPMRMGAGVGKRAQT